MVHVISFVSSAVQMVQAGWDGSIFAKRPSAARGTARVQPECGAELLSDFRIPCRQVKHDTT